MVRGPVWPSKGEATRQVPSLTENAGGIITIEQEHIKYITEMIIELGRRRSGAARCAGNPARAN